MNGAALVLAFVCAVLAGSFAGACHPEQPPVQPPQPTNPTSGRAGLTLAERETDASIVPEAGPVPPADAGIGLFDAAPVGPR